MKKLMIAAAIVCAAAFAQAGQVKWTSTYLNEFGQAGYTAPVVDGATVYLISSSASTFFADVVASDFATAISRATVVASATQGEDALTGASSSYPISYTGAGDVLIGNDETFLTPGSYTFFMAMNDAANNAFYISEALTDTLPGAGGATWEYTHDGAAAGNVFDAAKDGYQGAGVGGYYTVPEPTSGLLLLLGVAGLALRRRRA